jgi:hypothetical protein
LSKPFYEAGSEAEQGYEAPGLGITIMPVWKDLTDIVYVAIAEANLSRTVGLKWRVQQNSDIVKLFRVFAADYAWQSI